MVDEKHAFQAEVSRLLEIVAHSLYSNKEIFLRELISNASDACDRLRYQALTQPDLLGDDPGLKVAIIPDRAARRLTVADNGIGMNHDDLIENLGTIARSGTAAFMSSLTGDAGKDMALIGQFGVGFYSAFMVAEEVEVLTRKAGETQGWRWVSDGKGSFSVSPAEVPNRGTQVRLTLREDETEFLEPTRIEHIVKTYSDHIPLPIVLVEDGEERTLNSASALWTRPRGAVTDEQYKEFYHHVAHAFDEPWLTLHYRAEGVIEYSCLLFVPSTKPFDLFHPDRKHGVKLYVRRVFITDDCAELVPPYLRFLRGVVDSEDLPLNISREMLQHNPMLAKIRSGIVKRVHGELEKKASDAPEEYLRFWENFGAVLKEGLYEDHENRNAILKLCRFRSTAGEGWVGLDAYLGRLRPEQEHIFYMTGDDIESLRRNPHLEGYAARGVEVLLLTDPVDDFWMPSVGSYEGKSFRSVTRGGADLGKIPLLDEAAADREAAPAAGEVDSLIALFKLNLGEAVKDVRTSERLLESPACLVADEGDLDMHLERLLKQHQQIAQESRRILEINPRHPLIRQLVAMVKAGGAADTVGEVAHLLLDQARIVEGDRVPDPAAFSRRLTSLLARGLGGAAGAPQPAESRA